MLQATEAMARTQPMYGQYHDEFENVFGLRTKNQKPDCFVKTQMFLAVACHPDYLDFLLYTHPKAVKRRLFQRLAQNSGLCCCAIFLPYTDPKHLCRRQ